MAKKSIYDYYDKCYTQSELLEDVAVRTAENEEKLEGFDDTLPTRVEELEEKVNELEGSVEQETYLRVEKATTGVVVVNENNTYIPSLTTTLSTNEDVLKYDETANDFIATVPGIVKINISLLYFTDTSTEATIQLKLKSSADDSTLATLNSTVGEDDDDIQLVFNDLFNADLMNGGRGYFEVSVTGNDINVKEFKVILQQDIATTLTPENLKIINGQTKYTNEQDQEEFNATTKTKIEELQRFEVYKDLTSSGGIRIDSGPVNIDFTPYKYIRVFYALYDDNGERYENLSDFNHGDFIIDLEPTTNIKDFGKKHVQFDVTSSSLVGGFDMALINVQVSSDKQTIQFIEVYTGNFFAADSSGFIPRTSDTRDSIYKIIGYK